MSPNKSPLSDSHVIDIGRTKRKSRRWIGWIAAIVVLFAAARGLSLYISALWFQSLGFGTVYWSILEMKLAVFAVFGVATFVMLRAGFWLLEREFGPDISRPRTIVVNNQNMTISPGRIVRVVAWVAALVFAFFYGLGMRDSWREFALYLHHVPTPAADPVLGRPLSFYLFTLPAYDIVAGWLLFVAVVILIAAIGLSVMSALAKQEAAASPQSILSGKYPAVSLALAFVFAVLAIRVYLSRYPLLWQDHQSFTGVTYTEAHYLLPGLSIVAIVLLVSALLCLLNGFWLRRWSVVVGSIALPLAVFVVACVFVPAYITSFVVKPNELGRETPFIEANITATRHAFGLDKLEAREYEADASLDAATISSNRETIDNIRLWDWRALQDTLRQVQEIRTYYDFTDVDVDRYIVGGRVRQMMVAARELDVQKLPEQSRNWVNERLIYTHGYGVTMNTANGFTPEGMPQFILSNMPVESTSPEIKVTRPEIYFGQKTDTDVYVKTKQKEFDFPQGEANNYTTYEGTGGIALGSGLRRLLIAAALGDLSKVPFSDAITPETRALIHRNIRERVNSIAPFLVYDSDPYIVVTADGRLVWMIDAFTESSTYPYSRHYAIAGRSVNYIRNSVKVTIDAYNGTVAFYVFDPEDPIIQAYRKIFPSLFHDASEMPTDIRAHVRYPETLIRAQGEVFSLYHTQNPKSFFQREDVWSIANQVSLGPDQKQQAQPVDPYFVLMQLPGENRPIEFVEILPFTPANRNNMIGWMAGRSDGDVYGTLLIYDFPKSKLVDGPLQIEARIDQNAQLSGQFTLWNQQGSHVRRGNLLVVPIGKSLLYVEPIFLQAERSPMPELRLVVLATQDKLAYGLNFEEALSNLFGTSVQGQKAEGRQQPGEDKGQPAGPGEPQTAPSTQQLIKQAASDLDDYRKLTSEGKFSEAGKKLESATKALEELNKAANK